MIFHTPQKKAIYPTLKLNNANTERVSKFNFLGVVLTSTLKCDKHIGRVSLIVSRIIGVLFRLKHIYSQGVLLTLYNTLILPLLKSWRSENHTPIIIGLTKVNRHTSHENLRKKYFSSSSRNKFFMKLTT